MLTEQELAKLDGIVWTEYVRKIKGKPFSHVDDEHYMETIWSDDSQEITIMKSRQVRISEFAINWMLWQLDTINHISGLYALPTKSDASEFRDVRFKDMKKESEYLQGLINETDNKSHMKIKDSHLLFRGTKGEMSGRAMPADVLVFDEYNFIDFTQEDSMRASLDHSKMKRILNLSTPTLPSFGIHAKFKDTDAQEWFVHCDACGEDQILDFFKNIYKDMKEDSGRENFFGCQKCKAELDRTNGEWRATNPKGEGRGYHITQLMAKWKDADGLVKEYRDAKKKGRVVKFYQEKLGIPYRDGLKSVSDEDFIIGDYEMLSSCQLDGVSAGVDWGEHESWIKISRNETMQTGAGKEDTEEKSKVIYLERITASGSLAHAKRVDELINLFNIECLVCDFGYGAENNKYLFERHPSRVWACFYADGHKTYEGNWQEEKHLVSVNRTLSLQTSLNNIKSKRTVLPQKNETVELFIEHCKSIIKVKKQNSKGQEIEAFESTGPDHFGHANNYDEIAQERINYKPSINYV